VPPKRTPSRMPDWKERPRSAAGPNDQSRGATGSLEEILRSFGAWRNFPPDLIARPLHAESNSPLLAVNPDDAYLDDIADLDHV
jgi:hypothetical protein